MNLLEDLGLFLWTITQLITQLNKLVRHGKVRDLECNKM